MGLDVNVILANVLVKCGQVDESEYLLERCREQGSDKKLTGSPTQLILAASLASRLGLFKTAGALIDTACSYVKFHDDAGTEQKGALKVAKTLYRTSFRRPRILIPAFRPGFPKLGMIGGFFEFLRYDLIPRLVRAI